ncbi:MAG: hypothetical protein HYV09_38800 [Deltaproteobacteria bacterium]|nr:hypothetical protein [Deltaproteobacteria bacterium]
MIIPAGARLRRDALFGLFLSTVVGCGSQFDPPSRVTKLRLLAVTADQPWAHAGETVTLQALAHDPAGRAIRWGWATCTNPAAATVMGCLASLDPGSFVLGTSSHTIAVPPSVRVGRGAMIGVVTIACPGTLAQVPGQVPFRCNDGARDLATNEFEIGMKRVLLRATDRNENPRIDRVTFDGADWPEDRVPEVGTCAEEKVDDCPDAHAIEVRASRVESGVDELGTPYTEQLVIQYYATEGTFDVEVRTVELPETRWIARPHTAGTTIEVFLVARDDRGGSIWARRRVRVR